MVQTRRKKMNLTKGVTTRGGASMALPEEPERLDTGVESSAAPITVGDLN